MTTAELQNLWELTHGAKDEAANIYFVWTAKVHPGRHLRDEDYSSGFCDGAWTVIELLAEHFKVDVPDAPSPKEHPSE
jgi:hypothetical protein